jgi:hypothetical protein
MKAAGYQTTGLLTRTKDEPFIGADAAPEYLTRLKRRIAGSGLIANMGASCKVGATAEETMVNARANGSSSNTYWRRSESRKRRAIHINSSHLMVR